MKRAIYIGLIGIIIVAALTVALIQWQPTDNIASAIEAGICVHTLTAQDAALVSESGAKWIRIDISNNETDTTKSLINAKNHNLSVLGILGSWMFNESCVFTFNEWERAVSSNVSKYAPYVDAWEIWNEPTSTNLGWQLQADYLSMVQTASPIIRQYDPDAKIVLLGGLQLYTGGPATSYILNADLDFARNLSSYNLLQYGDVISVHAYPWSGQVSQTVWDNYNTSIVQYREIFGNSSLDIWVTETGQNLTDCNGDEVAHAQYLNGSLSFFNGKVSHVFWYALHDDNESLGDFGLVGAGMQPREAYSALKDALK